MRVAHRFRGHLQRLHAFGFDRYGVLHVAVKMAAVAVAVVVGVAAAAAAAAAVAVVVVVAVAAAKSVGEVPEGKSKVKTGGEQRKMKQSDVKRGGDGKRRQRQRIQRCSEREVASGVGGRVVREDVGRDAGKVRYAPSRVDHHNATSSG